MRATTRRIWTGLAREDAGREAVAEALLVDFNWGGGLAAGNIPGMIQELK